MFLFEYTTIKPGKTNFRFVICVALPKVLNDDIEAQLKFVTLFQNTYREEIDEFYLQLENTTENPHIQAAIKTSKRQRVQTLINTFKRTKEFEHTYVAIARNWEAAKAYAMKKDTRTRGPFTHATPYDEKLAARLGSFVFIEWQQKLMDYWSNYSADARILTWAWENVGNIGTFFYGSNSK